MATSSTISSQIHVKLWLLKLLQRHQVQDQVLNHRKDENHVRLQVIWIFAILVYFCSF